MEDMRGDDFGEYQVSYYEYAWELFYENWQIIKWSLVLFNVITLLLVTYKLKQAENLNNSLISKKKKDEDEATNRIALIIAHPDDEVMFFTPSIINLRDLGRDLYLLSLSNGNFEGLGKQREQELADSCNLLGIKHFKIVNDNELKDGMKEIWKPSIIEKYVADFVDENNIHSILSFDEKGVSDHPNHIAVHYGIK